MCSLKLLRPQPSLSLSLTLELPTAKPYLILICKFKDRNIVNFSTSSINPSEVMEDLDNMLEEVNNSPSSSSPSKSRVTPTAAAKVSQQPCQSTQQVKCVKMSCRRFVVLVRSAQRKHCVLLLVTKLEPQHILSPNGTLTYATQ